MDLQKAYLFAESDQERDDIINELEEYYLNLSVPDSIRQHVEQEIQTLLDTSEINFADYSEEILNEPNVYELENILKELVKDLMICKARNDEQSFQRLINIAEKVTKVVDKGKKSDYWVLFINKIKLFSKEKALSWLKAEYSTRYCYTYHSNDRMWKTGEIYGSLALKYLNITLDDHFYLDIMQRLQVILYMYHSYYELSFGIAKKYIVYSSEIKYNIRTCGILYNYANALHLNGQNDISLELFEKVLFKANKYKEIKSILWYQRNGLIRKASVLWQMGQYQAALNICNSINQYKMNAYEIKDLHMIKGLIQRNLGNYDIAEKEYLKAIKISEKNYDASDHATILNNLGSMFFSLTEYNKAMEYFLQANLIINTYKINDYDLHIMINANIAEVSLKINKYDDFKYYINKAKSQIEFVNLPTRKAQLLKNIGNVYLKNKKYLLALNNIQQAVKLYNMNGLIRNSLKTNIDLCKCNIDLKEYETATKIAKESLTLARQLNDLERVIDYSALLVEIERQNGSIDKAINISNKLISNIEKISTQFSNYDRLTSYRQKIYDYLKKPVLLEIQNNRVDSAFIKLNYAKAYSIKKKIKFRNIKNNAKLSTKRYINLKMLKNNLDNLTLIMDYFITKDSLFAFVLDSKGLNLYRKKIDYDHLESRLIEYTELLKRTVIVYNNYNKNNIINHYNSTIQLSHYLYNQLMSWPEFRSRLKSAETLFIIPDEFLYDLPFSTLTEESSENITFLVENTAVINLPSSSFLLARKSINLNLKSKKVLVSVDPSFPKSEKFINGVKQLFPLTEELSFQKDTFDKYDVIRELNNKYDIYIILGHGLANLVEPELSYIEMNVKIPTLNKSKPIKVSTDDLKSSIWTGTEIVLLIGCETGSGKLYRSTGISGLQQEFISMGVQFVLASLWKIDAESSIDQTSDILLTLSNISNILQVVRKSQINKINELKHDNYYKVPHPFFWGSFILSTTLNHNPII